VSQLDGFLSIRREREWLFVQSMSLLLLPHISEFIEFVSYTDNSDLLVKVVHVNDTTRVSLLSDNTKSIRSATWDPTGKYLVSL
jgi:hypothetical protein